MSFAEEVKTVTSSPSYKGTEQFNMEAGPAPASTPAPAEDPALPAGQAQTNPDAQVAPKDVSVVIGDKKFSSIQEAAAYAREEHAKAQGKLDAIAQLNQKPSAEVVEEVEAWEKQMEKLMFTDPAEYAKQSHAKAVQDAVAEIEKKNAKVAERRQREAIYENLMQSFLTENADLSDFRSVIENVVLADKSFYESIEHLPWNESKLKIAEQTRKLLKIKAGAEAKTTTLNSGAANMPGATGNPGQATEQVTSSTPMDFISQLRKANKRSK